MKFVVLVGDLELIPSKKSRYLRASINAVTDHYYRSIDKEDYYADINEPDVGVGRIPIKTEEELSLVLKKLTDYQTQSYNAYNSDRISFLASRDRYSVTEGTHNFVINAYTKLTNYFGEFPLLNSLGGDKLYAKSHGADTESLLSAFKQGRSVINYSGHGTKTYWYKPHFTKEDIKSLPESYRKPFVISNACLTAYFIEDESFGEAWIKHPGGAVAYWGSMDYSYWDEDDVLEKAMWYAIFNKGYTYFSDITNYALKEVWKRYDGKRRSRYYWETYVNLGDPSLKLRLKNNRHIITSSLD